MSYLDHDGLAYFKSKLDRTFIADIVFDDGDILLYGGDGTLLKTVVQEGTVTQKKSTTNKEYPILLCWDADAEEDQTMKTVWYGLDARVNPKFGFLYARRYYTEHPSYERTDSPAARVEWHHTFTDAVSAPMGEVYEYLDRDADGGEHRLELCLHGNPLSRSVDTPNHREATDAVSIGVGMTRGTTLTFFGYCPSTPIYEEDEETLRKSLVRGDQYGKDIITRDWLNLNGSITGLVHTDMNETIDGYKTFLKTVTIDSGNDNAKAGLNVQGDVNIDSGDNTKPSHLYVQGNSHTHGNETVDGKLTVGGTAEISGGSGSTPSLKVNGDEVVDGKLTAEDLEAEDDLTVGDDATIGGDLNVPNGTTTTNNLHVKDDAVVDDDLTVGNDENIKGKIYYVDASNNKTEYVEHIVSQPEDRKKVAQGLADTDRAIGYDSTTGKLYVKVGRGITIPSSSGTDVDKGTLIAKVKNKGGIAFDDSGQMYIDFSLIDDSDTKADIIASLDMQYALTGHLTRRTNSQGQLIDDAIYVDPAGTLGKGHSDDMTHVVDGATVKYTFKERRKLPFDTISTAVEWVSSKLALGRFNVQIRIVGSNNISSPKVFNDNVRLPEVNTSSGYVELLSHYEKKDVLIQSTLSGDDNTESAKRYYQSVITAGSGACHWALRNLICKLRLKPYTNASGLAFAVIGATTEGARIDVRGCDCIAEVTTNSFTSGYESFTVRMVDADNGGVIHLFPNDAGSKLTFALPTTNDAGVIIDVLNASRGGKIVFRKSTESSNGTYTCSGTCTNFIHCWQVGGTNRLGGAGTEVSFNGGTNSANVTGNSYKLQSGSYVMAPASNFPGQVPSDVSTVVESTHGCWTSGL